MELYYQFCVPEPFTVLGRKLKPYCLGHQILLKRFGNAFVSSVDKVTVTDLVQAVIICEQTFEGGIELIQVDDGLKHASRLFSQLKKKEYAESQAELFLKYLTQGKQGPENVNRKPGDISYAAPEALLKFALMTKCGYDESRALNMPYGQALYELVVWQEHTPELGVSFYNPDIEKSLREQADEFDARVQAAVKEEGGQNG